MTQPQEKPLDEITMNEKNTNGAEAAGGTNDLSKLLKQYGQRFMEFARADGLYEHHLAFDNVKDPLDISARDRFVAIARSIRDVLAQRWLATDKMYER